VGFGDGTKEEKSRSIDAPACGIDLWPPQNR
jgi:hypothetical protein